MNSYVKTHAVGEKEFIALIATLMSVVAISIDTILPALGIIGEELQVAHPNHVQYIVSFIFIGTALGQLISGPFSDALGRKKILYVGLLVYFIGSLLCVFSQTIEFLLFGRFIQGLGLSAPYICAMSIVRDKFNGRSMAKVMSLVMMIFIMVPVIAPALGQGILYFSSWRAIFVLYLFYALAVILWVFCRLEETLVKSERVPFNLANLVSSAKTILTNRITVSYTLTIGCVFGALIGNLNSIQQIFQVKFEVGNLFAVYFGLQALAMGVASLINSRLVERLGMRYICMRAIGLMIASSILFLMVNIFGEVVFWMYFLYGTVLLFCIGLLFGNLNALAMEPMGQIAGIASAIIGATSSVIGLSLGTFIGQLYDGSLLPIGIGFLILGVLAFIIMVFERSHLTDNTISIESAN